MKIRVRLEQFDLLENTSQVLVETSALLRENTLLYFESDGSHKHEIIFNNDVITLKRKGKEFFSETTLPLLSQGETKVHSPYGTMVMPAKLMKRSKTNEEWLVEYQLFQEKEVITHMRMVWHFTLQA